MTEVDRFWARVQKEDAPDGCWNWTGALNQWGYGVLVCDHKHWRAHRYSWFLGNGPIAPDLCVLHRCDNRKCVRPEHLFLGTQRENVRDMDTKGRRRSVVGSAVVAAKLTEAEVLHIRARAKRGNYAHLAREYGLDTSTVRGIVRRETWRHV